MGLSFFCSPSRCPAHLTLLYLTPTGLSPGGTDVPKQCGPDMISKHSTVSSLCPLILLKGGAIKGKVLESKVCHGLPGDRPEHTSAVCQGSALPCSHASWQVHLQVSVWPPKATAGAGAMGFQGHLEFLLISSERIKGNFIRLESLTNFLFLSPSLFVSLIFLLFLFPC